MSVHILFTAVYEVGILLLPLVGWALSRALKLRITPRLASFGIALMFAPVLVAGHGTYEFLPAYRVWIRLFMALMGGLFVGQTVFMLVSGIFPVGLATNVLPQLYAFLQRFRVPAQVMPDDRHEQPHS